MRELDLDGQPRDFMPSRQSEVIVLARESLSKYRALIDITHVKSHFVSPTLAQCHSVAAKSQARSGEILNYG